METKIYEDRDVIPRSEVLKSANQFAKLLAESELFQNLENAYIKYTYDSDASEALQKLQSKSISLRTMMALSAVSPEDELELQRLQQAFYNQPIVKQYTQAQDDLISASMKVGDILSEAAGLDFGSSCRTGGGCCG